MKFGHNLLRVIELSDPEWIPYWINYKLLKKLIKQLKTSDNQPSPMQAKSTLAEPSLQNMLRSVLKPSQGEGDDTAEKSPAGGVDDENPQDSKVANAATHVATRTKSDMLLKHPLEVAFFRLLHADLQKAVRFYGRMQEQHEIRVERLVRGLDHLNGRWSVHARAAFNVYKDLTMLQNFAVMTYCGLSKILKKHDKTTGRKTREAFMSSMVDTCNIADTSRLEELITSCLDVYSESSSNAVGQVVLAEDERLFLSMVAQINSETDAVAQEEGAPNLSKRSLNESFAESGEERSPLLVALSAAKSAAEGDSGSKRKPDTANQASRGDQTDLGDQDRKPPPRNDQEK